jgi:hypothetical protein
MFLTDQHFPPVLPTDDGNCAIIVRVEDGRLFEIEKVFKDMFATLIKPHGKLPMGSVILVGSLSHLGNFGLMSYAGDLVKTISSLSAVVGEGVDVVPSVFVPMGGIDDPSLSRAVFDLDAWITCDRGVTLGGVRGVFWGAVVGGDGGGSACLGERRYHLPSGIRNPRKRPIWSPVVSPPLPARIPSFTETTEARLVGAILKNLRESYGVKINISPSFEGGMATPVETGTRSRIIMVGASHMCRTAEFLPGCVNLAYSGFRLEKDMISNVENQLKN